MGILVVVGHRLPFRKLDNFGDFNRPGLRWVFTKKLWRDGVMKLTANKLLELREVWDNIGQVID